MYFGRKVRTAHFSSKAFFLSKKEEKLKEKVKDLSLFFFRLPVKSEETNSFVHGTSFAPLSIATKASLNLHAWALGCTSTSFSGPRLKNQKKRDKKERTK